MCLQQLNANLIAKIKPQSLEQLVQNGSVIKQGNNYYANPAQFGNDIRCFVTDSDGNPKVFQLDGRGTIVERTTPQSSGNATVLSQKTTCTASYNSLLEIMGLNGEDKAGLRTQFLTFLQTKSDIVKINMENNQPASIEFDKTKEAELYKAFNEFIDNNKESFTDGQRFITFSEDTDAGFISKLNEGNNAPIAEQPTEAGGRTYVVNDETALVDTEGVTAGDPNYNKGTARSVRLEVSSVTTTETEEDIVTVPDGLRDNKSARKQLEQDARDGFAELVANADPATRDAIDLYIAERKYHGQIDKKMGELLKDKTNGRTNNAADIIQLYIDQYANEADRAKLNECVNQIKDSNAPEDKKLMLAALKEAGLITTDNFDDLPDETKREGALIAMAKSLGYDSNTLLRLMATHDVMTGRTDAQKLKDDQWFIKEQAKDYVKNQQASQDIENTTVYFSKNGRKNAPEDGRIHTDIGDKGRTLVKKCPSTFCDEVKDGENFGTEDEGYFQAADGKRYKFNPDKWKAFMSVCCDPSRATDEELRVVFGNNEEAIAKVQELREKDINLSLQEGREILTMKLPMLCNDGKYRMTQLSQIFGNDNTTVDNKELNAFRNMVKSAGCSVDGNSTYGKRLLYVLKNAGIGAAIGAGTAGLSSLLSGAVNFGAETLTQVVTVTGKGNMTGTGNMTGDAELTGPASIDYTATATTTDTTTTIVGSESFTDTTTHTTYIPGTATGDVTLRGNTTITGGQGTVNGTGTVTGQVDTEVPERSGNNHGKAAVNGGILGAIGGGFRGVATMGGVHERGRNVDDVFSLRRRSTTSESETTTVGGQLNQYTYNRAISGNFGFEVEQMPVRPFQGPAEYNVLYEYEDGTAVSGSDFAAAYQTKVGGLMTNKNFYAYPEYTINGRKIKLKSDWKSIYPTIPEGTPGGAAGVNHTPSSNKVSGSGNIHS